MISQILSRLYVGDSEYTGEDLGKLGITYVINVGGKTTGFEKAHFHLSDDGNNPEYLFSTILNELSEKMMWTPHKILVCCRAGLSRSVYIVLLWLMKMGMSRDEAYVFIKERHSPAQINLELLEGLC